LATLAGGPVGPLVVVLSLAPVAATLRLLASGFGRPTNRVAGTAGERLVPFGLTPVRVRSRIPGAALAAGLAADLRANESMVVALIVTCLGLIGLLTAWGVGDLANAAAQPPPAGLSPFAGD
jgi:hypothetical protein